MEANKKAAAKATYILILSIISICCIETEAAIKPHAAGERKTHKYIDHGTIAGGEAGTAYTLLDIRRLPAPKDKIERVLLDLGDSRGQPLKNQVSYFQVSLDLDTNRLVIDLPQMLASGVTVEAVQKLFKASPFVRESRIHFDPVDATITVQLLLKKAIRVEVFTLPSKDKASRIAIDLKEKV